MSAPFRHSETMKTSHFQGEGFIYRTLPAKSPVKHKNKVLIICMHKTRVYIHGGKKNSAGDVDLHQDGKEKKKVQGTDAAEATEMSREK